MGCMSNAHPVLADAAAHVAPPLTGPQWEARVMGWARAMGWIVFHPHDARRSEPGYPDITAVHPGKRRAIWIECKTGRGKLTLEQAAWRDALRAAGCEWYEARPEREADVLAILAGRPADVGKGQGTGGQR